MNHVEVIAKITGTRLGWEDHGIFLAWLDVDYGGSAQSVCGLVLDEPYKDADGKHLGRRGTAEGHEFICRVIKACGVDTWEKVKGRTIMVYKDSDRWGANVLGIGPLPTEPGTPFMFSDVFPEAAR